MHYSVFNSLVCVLDAAPTLIDCLGVIKILLLSFISKQEEGGHWEWFEAAWKNWVGAERADGTLGGSFLAH